jgi:Ca2+-binding EF-hand superfamily protein
MNSVQLANQELDVFIVDKIRLASQGRKKLPNLVITTKSSHLMSPPLTRRKLTRDPVHDRFNRIIKQRYPTIQIVLGTIDYRGKGSIFESDLLNFFKKFHFDYTDEEILNYIKRLSLITANGKIDKAALAKAYYGHHFRNNFEAPELVSAVLKKQEEQDFNEASMHKINNVVSERLKRIENVIKTKLSSNWKQIRTAFLDIDTDYDGFVTVKDLTDLCYGAFDIEEMKMLMKCRGSGKDYKIDFNKF